MGKSILRLAERKDTAAILEIYAPYITGNWASFEKEVPTELEMWHRIKGVLKEAPWLVYIADTQVAGYAYASSHRSRYAYHWNREVSAYVHPDFQSQGIGRLLYNALFEILGMQGYCNLLAGIVMPNPASIAFHEKMGFELLGTYRKVGYKLGAWRDVSWYQKWIGGDGQPGLIRKFSELDRTPHENILPHS